MADFPKDLARIVADYAVRPCVPYETAIARWKLSSEIVCDGYGLRPDPKYEIDPLVPSEVRRAARYTSKWAHPSFEDDVIFMMKTIGSIARLLRKNDICIEDPIDSSTRAVFAISCHPYLRGDQRRILAYMDEYDFKPQKRLSHKRCTGVSH